VDADLVLMHGFWSSPTTWDRLIPSLRDDADLAGLRIHNFEYESPKLRWPASPARIPDYNDIAQSLPAYLATHAPGSTPIAMVTHSQGGLILQRFLAWMLTEGRGLELSRFRLAVMLSCPNEGSEYVRSIRAVVGFSHHPQASQLDTLNREVREARRIVLRQVVNATTLDDRHCPIPIFVYSGRTDNIVRRESAQSVFPNAEVLPGDHFSILNPEASGNLTGPTIKRHLIDALTKQGLTHGRFMVKPLVSSLGPRSTRHSSVDREVEHPTRLSSINNTQEHGSDVGFNSLEFVAQRNEDKPQATFVVVEVVGTDRYGDLMDALSLVDPGAEFLWGQYGRFAASLTREDFTQEQIEEVLAFRGLPYRINLEHHSFGPRLLSRVYVEGPDGRRFEIHSVPNTTRVQEISSSILGEYSSLYFKEGDLRPVGTVTNLVLADGKWAHLNSNSSLHEAGIQEDSLLMISIRATAG